MSARARRPRLLTSVATGLLAVAVTAVLAWFAGTPQTRSAALAPRSTPAATTPTPATTTPLRVVGLGDSVAAGSVCGCTSFITLVGRQLAARGHSTAAISNLAAGGMTSSDVLEQLSDPAVRATLAGADLVIVTVGANDLDSDDLTSADCQKQGELSCYSDSLATVRQNLADILAQLGTAGVGAGHTVVTGYWNDFLDGAVAARLGPQYVAASDTVTRAANAAISADTRAAGATYVDLYTAFKGDGTQDCTWLLAPDGDHPDAAGHQVIADAVLSALAA